MKKKRNRRDRLKKKEKKRKGNKRQDSDKQVGRQKEKIIDGMLKREKFVVGIQTSL